MNNNHSENHSALLDGELDKGAHNRTISGLLADDEALARFGRYRMIGDVLRGEYVVDASSVVDRVASTLADEPVVLAPRRRRSWARPLTGAAIAASVAAGALFVSPQILDSGVSPGGVDGAGMQIAEALPVGASTAAVQTVADRDSEQPRWQAVSADLQHRLNRMVIEHHEFGGRSGIMGPVAHVDLVNYEAR